ncbi:hypothetical protein LJR034_005316 [Caballeronia sp. LjRoot34]
MLVKFQPPQINQLQGLFEFGKTFCAGRVARLGDISERMAELLDALPRPTVLNLNDQLRRIGAVEEDIDQLKKQLCASKSGKRRVMRSRENRHRQEPRPRWSRRSVSHAHQVRARVRFVSGTCSPAKVLAANSSSDLFQNEAAIDSGN